MEWGKSSFEPHPVGVYEAALVNFEDVPEGEFGPQVKLSFDTSELMNDGRPYRVNYYVKPNLHPKSNAYKVLKALGVDPDELAPEDVEATLDELISKGAKCQLVINEYTRRDKSTSTKVTDILPVRQARQRPAAGRQPVGAAAGKGASDKAMWNDDDD